MCLIARNDSWYELIIFMIITTIGSPFKSVKRQHKEYPLEKFSYKIYT